jgi:hypothetical protein
MSIETTRSAAYSLLLPDTAVRDFLPEVPRVILPAGGYARNIAETVELHAQTIKIMHGRL